MKTNLFKILAVFFALSVFTISSCEKLDPDTQSAEDDARGGYMMADAFAASNDNVGGDGSKSLNGGSMAVSTPDNGTNGLSGTTTITYTDYDDGKTVKNGQIIIDFIKVQNTEDSIYTYDLEFKNFSIDGTKLEGVMDVSFVKMEGEAYVYTIEEGNEDESILMKATFADGKTMTWKSDKTIVVNDDNIVVSGDGSGTNTDGKAYTTEYVSINKKFACKYPVSGTVSIESDNGTTLIDYGNGECDNIISVTNNGITVEITLD